MTRPSRLCRHSRKTRAEALFVREQPAWMTDEFEEFFLAFLGRAFP